MGAEGLNREIHTAHYSVFPEDFENKTPESNAVDGHKITDIMGHDVNPAIERVEFVPEPAPDYDGSWADFGENVFPINGERSTPEEKDSLRMSNSEPVEQVGETEQKVVEWREPAEKVLPTGAEEITPQVEGVLRIPNLNMSASGAEISARRESVVQTEGIKNILNVLGSKGREFFQNMPEKAKQVASGMYEGVYKIPGVNRLVAKAEIAWNQGWIDRKQDRVIELNDKVREISAESAILGESESALKEALETIRSSGFGSTAKIEKSLRQISSRKIELGEKKTTFENKVSRKQESMTSFVEKRNEITERMVGKYAERVKPLEAKMENIRGLQDALEFQTAIMEADHAEKMIEIIKLDEKRAKVYDSLRSAGQLDKNGSHPALRTFDTVISASKMKIADAEAVVKAKERAIKARIKTTEDTAKVYKDKAAEFSAIKNRSLYTPETPSAPEKTVDRELEESELESGFAEEEHLAESSRLSIGTFLDKWNDHLNDTVSDEKRKTSLTIDKAAFLKGARWNEDKELDYEHFVKVLDGYYRMKKVDFKDKAEMAEKFKGAKIDNK